jgi:hypothetical protein
MVRRSGAGCSNNRRRHEENRRRLLRWLDVVEWDAATTGVGMKRTRGGC